MKTNKYFFTFLLIFNLCILPSCGQNVIRDSLIDESLKDFFSEHDKFIAVSEYCMMDMLTFPYDYDLSKWITENNIGIANFQDKKNIKLYKKTKTGIPTICFKWKMNIDGSLSFYFGLYYVKKSRNVLEYALSEVYIYCYKYSDSEGRWILYTKSHNGV